MSTSKASASQESPTPSGELPQLSEDILMQILSRLPAKSLLRFSTNRDEEYGVGSKVISFISDQTSSLLRNMDIDITSSLSLSPDMLGVTLDGEVQVFGPCNGVICLTNLYDIVLCNPAIREYRAVPLPPFSYPRDLQSRTEGVGFGYDPITNDYKVIRISELFEDEYGYSFDSFRVEIYNMSTDSWRHVDVDIPIDVGHFPCFEIFFNGAFHFYGCDGVDSESILSFDITKEEFRSFGFPPGCFYPDGRYRSLSVLNDSLALILYKPSDSEKCFDVWVMSEYGVEESWSQVFSIGPLPGIDCPLTVWKDRELLLESSSGQLVSCYLENQEIKEFSVYGFPKTLRALPYKESLVSIKRGSHLGEHGN
ncbi:hypothetical protein NMG60_11006224 [Bertholletia excelsa]